jgi:excisionase family DNA binding protein
MSLTVDDRELLTVPEAAERLRVSEKTARRLISRAELPAVQFGGPGSTLRVSPAGLEAWLEKSRVAPQERRAPGTAAPAVEARPPG